MEPIIKHFTDDDLYKFTMCAAVIENFPRAQVKYTFIDRNDQCYPAGFDSALREQIQHLENLIITDEEIAYMKKRCNYIPQQRFDSSADAGLYRFRFRCYAGPRLPGQ